MMFKLFSQFGLSVLLALAFAAGSVSADTVIVPSTHTGSNVAPIIYNSRYQQVYDAGQFPGALTISAIGFLPGYSVNYSATLSLSLGPTTKAVGTLTTNQNTNITTPLTTVIAPFAYSGTMTAYNWWMLSFDTPFEYDPTDGNLLIEFNVSGPSWTGAEYAALRGVNNSGVASRSYPWTDNYGLTTLFVTEGIESDGNTGESAPVPTAAGMFALVGAMLLRRRGR